MEVVVIVHAGQTTTSEAQTHLGINTISKQKLTTHEQKTRFPNTTPNIQEVVAADPPQPTTSHTATTATPST